MTSCVNVKGGSSSSYGGVIPRSRSSSGQALYMGLNGDSYQRSTSVDDGSGQVGNSCITQYLWLSWLLHEGECDNSSRYSGCVEEGAQGNKMLKASRGWDTVGIVESGECGVDLPLPQLN